MSRREEKAAWKRFRKQDPSWRNIVVYAESRNDWAHLGPVVDRLLDHHGVRISYLTSEVDDPIFERDHAGLESFFIGDGSVRTMAFRGLEADIVLTTTPDLGTYDVKRSINPVHYVYLFHALVSTHMVYRPGAFDEFDTVLCVGPHHAKEIRAAEEHYGTKRKRLLKHGYGRLDQLVAEAAAADRVDGRVVLAGTWGPDAMMERTEGTEVARHLLGAGYEVIIRLHPMTVRYHPDTGAKLEAELAGLGNLRVETDIRDRSSLLTSSVLVSDWSGAAFEYALGLERPVISVNVPPKINNPQWQDIGIEPIERALRSDIGHQIDVDAIADVVPAVNELVGDQAAFASRAAALRDEYVYNVGESDEAAASWVANAAKALAEG